jgi:hypothetical protein
MAQHMSAWSWISDSIVLKRAFLFAESDLNAANEEKVRDQFLKQNSVSDSEFYLG